MSRKVLTWFQGYLKSLSIPKYIMPTEWCQNSLKQKEENIFAQLSSRLWENLIWTSHINYKSVGEEGLPTKKWVTPEGRGWRRGIKLRKERCRYQPSLCRFHNTALAPRRRSSESPGMAGKEKWLPDRTIYVSISYFPIICNLYKKKKNRPGPGNHVATLTLFWVMCKKREILRKKF